MSVHTMMIAQPLAQLLYEARQAHFLSGLTREQALIILLKRHKEMARLLLLYSQPYVHPDSMLLLEHTQMLLAAELAWIERTLDTLQKWNYPPEWYSTDIKDTEHTRE